jgi:hypothetical protein
VRFLRKIFDMMDTKRQDHMRELVAQWQSSGQWQTQKCRALPMD